LKPLGEKRALRIVHCPSSAAGVPQGMAHYESVRGLESRCFSYQAHIFGYEDGKTVYILAGSNPLVWFRKGLQFAIAVFRADVIHFNFGHSMLPATLDPTASGRMAAGVKRLFNFLFRPFEMIDLLVLRWMGKKTIMLYQGSDARQKRYCLENHEITFADQFPSYNEETDCQKQFRIRRVEKWCDHVLSVNPDLLDVLPPGATFHPYPNITIDADEPVYPEPKGEVCILHAPSNRATKGSDLIIEALEELKREGVPLRLNLVEGISHEELLEQVAEADLVVDQILSGWYGGFSVEAMSLGKPVVCYIRESDLEHLPPGMAEDLPFIQADPTSFKKVMRELIVNRVDELNALGRKSRAFVEAWHHPAILAEERESLYRELLNR